MLAAAGLPERLLFITAAALLASPFAAVTWAWFGWAKTPQREWKSAAVLVLTSVSYLLLLSILFMPEIFGPHYSLRRFATIYSNLVLMILAVGWSAVDRAPMRRQLLMSTTLLAVAWAYMAVVSSVV